MKTSFRVLFLPISIIIFLGFGCGSEDSAENTGTVQGPPLLIDPTGSDQTGTGPADQVPGCDCPDEDAGTPVDQDGGGTADGPKNDADASPPPPADAGAPVDQDGSVPTPPTDAGTTDGGGRDGGKCPGKRRGPGDDRGGGDDRGIGKAESHHHPDGGDDILEHAPQHER